MPKPIGENERFRHTRAGIEGRKGWSTEGMRETWRVMNDWNGSLKPAITDPAASISMNESGKHLQEENMTGCKHLTERGWPASALKCYCSFKLH